MHLTRCACLFLFVLVGCSDEKGPLSGLAGSLSNDTFQTNPPDDDDNGDNDESDAETGPPVTSGDPATGDPPTTDGPTTDPPPTDTTDDPTTAGPTSEPGFCGDNKVDRGEDCDLEDLGGVTCEDLGFDGGTLFCQLDCTFETSLCNASAGCGNGAIDGAEDCDCGGDTCSPAELGNNDCSDVGFGGGSLHCDPVSCTFDTSGCNSCGNGTIDPGEQCDGNNLGGFDCESLGNTGGTLACDDLLCVFDASGCTNTSECGDGTCDPNEDSCSCAPDCPDNPNSCSPCQCGGNGGSCYCDAACVENNDCCANGPC